MSTVWSSDCISYKLWKNMLMQHTHPNNNTIRTHNHTLLTQTNTYHTWFWVDMATSRKMGHLLQKGRKLECHKNHLALGPNIKPWSPLCFKDMQGTTRWQPSRQTTKTGGCLGGMVLILID